MAKISKKKVYKSQLKPKTVKQYDLSPNEVLDDGNNKKNARRRDADNMKDFPRKYRMLMKYQENIKKGGKKDLDLNKKSIPSKTSKTTGKVINKKSNKPGNKRIDGEDENGELIRGDNETLRDFMQRLDDKHRSRFILAAKSKTKTYQKRKEFLKNKKQAKKNKKNNDDQYKKDIVSFGDVVLEPPRLKVIPRKVFKDI